MKVLMIHNTLTVYRVPFFLELSEHVDLTVMFYQLEKNEIIYKDKDRISELAHKKIKVYKIFDPIIYDYLKEGQFDYVILPPIDDLFSLKIANKIIKIDDVKKAIWWGKWESPKINFLSKRYVKNTIQRKLSVPILKKVNLCLSYGSKATDYLINSGVTNDRVVEFTNSTEVQNSSTYINIKERNKINSNKKVILYLGRVIERKGLDYLLNAFKLLDSGKYHLIICGTGPDLDNYIKHYANDSITFEGYVKPEVRSNYYNQSDIFVIPSYSYKGTPEPWGLTVNEAQQYNLPVVATTAVGAAYDLISEKTGVIAEEGEVEALKNAILDIDRKNIDKKQVEQYKKNVTPKTMAYCCYKGMREN